MSNKPTKEIQPAKTRKKAILPIAEVAGMLRSMPESSKESWTIRHDALWSQYVESFRESELETLISEGLEPGKAEKLIQLAWVKRDPQSGDFVTEPAPSKDSAASVPVILVFRNGSFGIHEIIRGYLDYHPALSSPGSELPSDEDDRASLLRMFDEVDTIEDEMGLGHLGLYHLGSLLPDHVGEDNRIADCGMGVYRLRCLLDSKFQETGSHENLEWLDLGMNGKRLWSLLRTAVFFGEARERRRILDERGAEEKILRMVTTPPGKGGKLDRAIAKIIEAYALEKKSLPTAKQLRIWLGGTVPYATGEPLEVDHVLWTDVLRNVSWSKFQNLVREAKKKMKG